MIESRGKFVDLLSKHWWMVALRGVLAIAFGVIAFMWPGITLMSLVLLFGAYALINGIITLVHAFSAPKGYPRFGRLIFEGLLSMGAGIAAFVWPGITALALILLIAAWAVANGIVEIASAVELRKVIKGEWLLILAGIVSIAFGILLFMRPAVGAVAVIWWIAAFAIVFGVLLLALSWRLRSYNNTIHAPPTAPA